LSIQESKTLIGSQYSNFSLTILEYCEASKCLEREDDYTKKFNSEYNIAKKPGAPMSGRNHSDETKQKISDIMKGKNHIKIHSDKTKQIMSDAKKGENNPNFGKNHSDESKQKISDSMPNNVQISVFDIQNNQTTTYNSIRAAARDLEVDMSIITKYFRRNQQKPYKGRYTFKKL
jgi:group I intron endonuclease